MDDQLSFQARSILAKSANELPARPVPGPNSRIGGLSRSPLSRCGGVMTVANGALTNTESLDCATSGPVSVGRERFRFAGTCVIIGDA